MRFSKFAILVCAAIYAPWFGSQVSCAENAPLVLDPLTLGMDPLASTSSDVPTDATLQPQSASHKEINGTEELLKPFYECACGCGVFEVGTASMFPHGQGGMTWIEYDYQDQNHNRHGTGAASGAANPDTDIRTDFFDLGFQYFFNRKWGVMVEVPFDHRHFVSAGQTTDWTALGDIRLRGEYTGFFEDQSLGIDFGVKLASGNFTHAGPDRDTEIGTGSNDILLGGFYRTNLSADHNWNFYAQLESDLPVIIADQYRPGFEVDGAAGIYYSGFKFHRLTISPIGQVILSYRTSDGGDNSAHPVASGYERVLLSPGIEFDIHPFTIYADIEIPVFQYFRGDQIAANNLVKIIVSYHF